MTIVPPVEPIPESEFEVGDVVVCIDNTTTFPLDWGTNWADEDHDKLEVNKEYTIVIGNSGNSENSNSRVRLKDTIHSYWHDPKRFRLLSKTPNIGTKLMPQVIETCDVQSIEHDLFQSIADKMKKDIFIYNGEPRLVEHPPSMTTGLHFYYNAVNKREIRLSAHQAIPGLRIDLIKCSHYFNNPVNQLLPELMIPLVVGPYTEIRRLDSYDNAYFFHYNPLTTQNSYEVRLFHLIEMNRLFGPFPTLAPEFSASIVAPLLVKSASQRVKERIRQQKNSVEDRIRQATHNLTSFYAELAELNVIKVDEVSLDIQSLIDKLREFSYVRDVHSRINYGTTIEMQIVITTYPIVVHLKHGDIPTGGMVITFSMPDECRLNLSSPWFGLSIGNWHPAFNAHPCFGGFDAMIHKMLVNYEFPVIVDLLMRWFQEYDGSGMFSRWVDTLSSRYQIIINEDHFMIGEDEDE
jgi:hypothetical protein